jgi:hypothetical protein
MTFNTVRALSLRIGDKVPAPIPHCGGWDRTKALCVTNVQSADGVQIFTLENGATFRAFPMNTIPFMPRNA